MIPFCKDARAARLRYFLLVVVLLSVLVTAQADPVYPPKSFVTFSPQDDMQILAVAEHDCNFTDVNFAVGTGVKNSYRCHVISGLDALLGRGASTGTVSYPDGRRPTPNPAYTAPRGGMGGTIVISFDTPSGAEIHQFVMNGSNLRALEPPAGAILHFTSQWRVLNSDIPTVGQLSPGPYAMAMNAPDGAQAKPLPTATSKLHLDVQGTECTAQYEGLPKTVCAIDLWTPQWISVVVSGTYLKQPDKFVKIDLHPVANDPGHWFFMPTQFTPYSPLLAAVQKNDVAAVQVALAQGANPSDHPAELEAPLATAVQRRNLDIANLLVDHGADVNVTATDGASVLVYAIGTGGAPQDHARWFEFDKKLISHHADVDRVAPGSLTPLMAAMTLSVQRDVVELLLASGANVNATTTLSQGLFGLSGRPITAYDLAQAELDAFSQMKAMQGFRQGETDPVPLLQEVMALLAQHGAKFLPNGGALATDRVHFENGSGGAVTLVGSPGAAVDGETITVTDVTTSKTSAGRVAKDGTFRVNVIGAPADLYGLALSRDKLAGNQVYLHGNDPAPSLKITSPVAGAVVDGDVITVTGTYAGPLNTGIMVGDQAATVINGRFVVSDVILKPGVNTFPIGVSTLGAGLKVVQTLTVSCKGRSPLHLSTTGYLLGPAPLEENFNYSFASQKQVQTLKMSFLGNGKDDVATTDPDVIKGNEQNDFGRGGKDLLKHIYTTPGAYPATVTVIDSTGAKYQAQLTIVVEDPDQMDAIFKSLWSDFTSAMASGNKDAAMYLLSDNGRQNLGPVLDTLMSKGKDIVSTFSPLLRSSISTNDAEYAIVRPSADGKKNLFFVGFIRYPDGVWHIDSL